MRARRSRISRFYRRITRRSPDRKAQWREIGLRRVHGTLGRPTSAFICQAHIPDFGRAALEPGVDDFVLEEWTPADVEAPETTSAAQDKRQSTAIALLTVSLFVLGCAYAAFAGYILAFNVKIANFGVLGAVIALTAAGIGISLAGSPQYRQVSRRFLGLSAASLSVLYVALMLTSLGR